MDTHTLIQLKKSYVVGVVSFNPIRPSITKKLLQSNIHFLMVISMKIFD